MLGKKLISARSYNLAIFGRNLTTLKKPPKVKAKGG